MIKSFNNEETKKIFDGYFSKKSPKSIQHIALRKLILINSAIKLKDLQVPPGNHLEPLSGDRIGQWSIRINKKYRIVFIPINNGSDYINVEIIDYH